MTPSIHTLADPAHSGVSSLRGAEAAALAAAARRADLAVHRIDLRGCRGKAALLKRLARALHTPLDQGRNWDALADQLRDLGWLPAARGRLLLFTHMATLRAHDPASFALLQAVLADAAEHWRSRDAAFQAVFALPDAGRN